MSRSDDSGGDPEENGLDLSMGKKRRSGDDDEDENHVSTTAKDEYVNGDGVGSNLPVVSAASAPPFPTFPFPFGGILPPVPPGTDPSLTEHLMKLTAAGLPPPPPSPSTSVAAPPPPRIEDLTAKPLQAVTSSLNLPSTSSHPYTVLSAMLGKAPYQPVFPGMGNGIFPKQNGSSALPPPAVAVAAAVGAESAKDTASGLGEILNCHLM